MCKLQFFVSPLFLEMKILNLLVWIKFLYLFLYTVVLNKTWKIYWSEQSLTCLGPEDRCSLWGTKFDLSGPGGPVLIVRNKVWLVWARRTVAHCEDWSLMVYSLHVKYIFTMHWKYTLINLQFQSSHNIRCNITKHSKFFLLNWFFYVFEQIFCVRPINFRGILYNQLYNVICNLI